MLTKAAYFLIKNTVKKLYIIKNEILLQFTI